MHKHIYKTLICYFLLSVKVIVKMLENTVVLFYFTFKSLEREK